MATLILVGFANLDSLFFVLAILALILAVILGILGLVKKGSISADASGGIVLGNFPVWALSLWLLWGASVGYQESLPFCQIGLSYAPPRCVQAPEYLAIIGMLGVSLIITAMVTMANLLNLKRLSQK